MEKMNFGELRDAIEGNRSFVKAEQINDHEWYLYDSSIESFGKSFIKVLPKQYKEQVENFNEGDILKKYIEETLESNSERTAIEFGGPGSKLFSEFSSNFFKKTVGVCLEDIRSLRQIEKDNSSNHGVIVGDILDVKNTKTFNEIKEKLGAEKIDLIISRMAGPLIYYKRNPALLDAIVRKWYSMLAPNGIILAQYKMTVDVDAPDVSKWVETIKEKFQDLIEVEIEGGVIRLHKKVEAPEQLPKFKELIN